MIGKLIGAAIGGQVAKQARGISGPTGAVLGFIAPAILRRVSIPGMLALAAGGYAAKKYAEKNSYGGVSGRPGATRY